MTSTSKSPPPHGVFGRFYVDGDLKHDQNSFTALRWILASSVMFSHGWDLTQYTAGLDPSVAILSLPVSRLAVFLFFTLSGFLVTGGLVHRGVYTFAVARGLRLLPGLWVMLLFTTVVLWLLFSSVPLGDYVRSPMTHAYLFRNALLLGDGFHLPGIWVDHESRNNINGSLWTIPQEVRCYIMLALLAAIGVLARRSWMTLVFALFVVAHLLTPIDAVPLLVHPRNLGFSFFIGVMFYMWRDRLWLSWPLALVLAAGSLGLPDGQFKQEAIQLVFGYGVLVAAFCVPMAVKRFSAKLPDYSYGIYIYAFPAQQTVIEIGIGTTPLTNIATGFALMLPFAALSWHLIEKPALGLKDRFKRKPRG